MAENQPLTPIGTTERDLVTATRTINLVCCPVSHVSSTRTTLPSRRPESQMPGSRLVMKQSKRCSNLYLARQLPRISFARRPTPCLREISSHTAGAYVWSTGRYQEDANCNNLDHLLFLCQLRQIRLSCAPQSPQTCHRRSSCLNGLLNSAIAYLA
jgi:hypothetical protein